MADNDKAARRVARYRSEYADRPWPLDAPKDAYEAATGACIQNALDALASDSTESLVWVELAQLHSFRYRRAF